MQKIGKDQVALHIPLAREDLPANASPRLAEMAAATSDGRPEALDLQHRFELSLYRTHRRPMSHAVSERVDYLHKLQILDQ